MTALAYAAGVLLAVLGLGLSIALHEIGHLVPAKRFGVKVTQYMIGFGPTLFSRRRGETEYGIKAIPLGGYIRMIGMFPPRRDDPEQRVRADSTGFLQQMQRMSDEARDYDASLYDPADAHRTFAALSVPRKLIVMVGGPTMNLLISVVMLTVLSCGVGMPQLTPTVHSVSQCVVPVDAPADAGCEGRPAAPAAAAGIRPGDRLLSIDGHRIETWDDATAAIRGAGDRTIPVVVDRDGTQRTLQVTPILDDRPVLDADGQVQRRADGSVVTERAGFLGVSPSSGFVRQSPLEVPGLVWRTFSGTVHLVIGLPARLVDVAQAAFGTEERDPNGPIGVVGVSRLAGEVVAAREPGIDLQAKLFLLVSMLGSLNMALFVFNLVPLLPLDGGHMAGALVEGARRMIARWRGQPDPGPVDTSRMLPVANVVFMVFLVMTMLLLYADIVRPVRLFP
ncbi:site-2 protease family protein [Brachybacterium sp. EF45031]|uniref:M50 family metallopeptidase n=1 Tax=Brachybacterium sillae TaxID=2810536 RepID=UPI00217D8CF4|nr:site-2 protease family protein [Brachybacterium sillae]MCS6712340.1 site-2 protease family protein [Brachybacterium sillae]